MHDPGQEQKRDDDREPAEQPDLDDGVVVDRLSHARLPATRVGLWIGKRKGPNLPTPLGSRTLLRRWASAGPVPRDLPDTDSQADCAGSQLERLSNKLEPSLTIAVKT